MYGIYTLYYKDTGLYNHNVFIVPNDETAKKAMKLNLQDSKNERFRNECKTGEVELHKLCDFDEQKGIYIEADEEDFDGYGGFVYQGSNRICNLKDLINDDTGNMETVKSN